MSIKECYLFNIDSYEDSRGGLSILEEGSGIPFQFKRLYYLYDTSKEHVRGVHAHKKLEQIIIALSGKFSDIETLYSAKSFLNSIGSKIYDSRFDNAQFISNSTSIFPTGFIILGGRSNSYNSNGLIGCGISELLFCLFQSFWTSRSISVN